MPQIKTALISVYDKQGVVEFARGLQQFNVHILSTGGTARALQQAGIAVTDIASYTGAPEMLSGRVKTLHPKIHGGLLALRDDATHRREMDANQVKPIDMVVVNLYPFLQVIQRPGITIEEAIENIDIGGPTMLRSAAKNHKYVAAVSHPGQYKAILNEMEKFDGNISTNTCRMLARETFELTAAYDSYVSTYLQNLEHVRFPDRLTLSFQKRQSLRYGENPHQEAAFYAAWSTEPGNLAAAEQVHGKEISYNNLLDLEAAVRIVREFTEPAAVVIKHNNPCGAAVASTLPESFIKAHAGDPVSAFGSIVSFNQPVDRDTASAMLIPGSFIEAVIAPSFSEDAISLLEQKASWGKRVILLATGPLGAPASRLEFRGIPGGLLLQEENGALTQPEAWKTVSQRRPSSEELQDLSFAWKICKHVKSNAIVLAGNQALVGVGAGQMSRVDAAIIAVRKAGERSQDAVLASDAFFPFPDALEHACKAGVRAAVEPGGSKRDQEVIEAADRLGTALLFTGRRHFKH